MTMEYSITIQEILPYLQASSYVIGVVGLGHALNSYRYQNKLKRSEYVLKVHSDFLNDADMLEVFYLIDNGVFQQSMIYGEGGLERKLDKLLGHFNNISRMFNHNILKMEDADCLIYHILKIYRNKNVSNYLSKFNKYSESIGYSNSTYAEFNAFAEMLHKRFPEPRAEKSKTEFTCQHEIPSFGV
jgi:hypothetical protein